MNAELQGMQGDFIDEPFEAEDQGQCCSACLQQALDQKTSHERKPICNFWYAYATSRIHSVTMHVPAPKLSHSQMLVYLMLFRAHLYGVDIDGVHAAQQASLHDVADMSCCAAHMPASIRTPEGQLSSAESALQALLHCS